MAGLNMELVPQSGVLAAVGLDCLNPKLEASYYLQKRSDGLVNYTITSPPPT